MEIRDATPYIAEISRRYEYQEAPQFLVEVQDWIAQVLRWIYDVLSSFRIVIPGIADSRAASVVMQFLLYLAGMAAAAAIIYLVWTRLGYLRGQSRSARSGKSITQSTLDSESWRRQAAEMAGREQWRDACRCTYLSLLRLLSEYKIAEFAPARTNYEYWYALAGHPALQRGFRELSRRVESVWFGGAKAYKEDYEFCLQRVDDLAREIVQAKQRASAG